MTILKTALMMEGPHLLFVDDAQKATSRSGRPIIRIVLRDEDGFEMPKYFVTTGTGQAYFIQFAQACGLDEKEARRFEPSLLVGRKVGAEIFHNENGYLDARGWSRVSQGECR